MSPTDSTSPLVPRHAPTYTAVPAAAASTLDSSPVEPCAFHESAPTARGHAVRTVFVVPTLVDDIGTNTAPTAPDADSHSNARGGGRLSLDHDSRHAVVAVASAKDAASASANNSGNANGSGNGSGGSSDDTDASTGTDGIYTMQSEVDPSRTIRLAQAPYDTIGEVFKTIPFVMCLVSIVLSMPVIDIVIFLIVKYTSDPSEFVLARTMTGTEVLMFLASFTSLQILLARPMTMSKIRSGQARGLRMSALNDTWWKRIFFFFADTKTLMKKWPLAVLNALLFPGLLVAAYIICGCQFIGNGLGECKSTEAGSVMFSISWKIISVLCIVPPHFVSACNVEHVWNQVDGLEIMKRQEEGEKEIKADAHQV